MYYVSVFFLGHLHFHTMACNGRVFPCHHPRLSYAGGCNRLLQHGGSRFPGRRPGPVCSQHSKSTTGIARGLQHHIITAVNYYNMAPIYDRPVRHDPVPSRECTPDGHGITMRVRVSRMYPRTLICAVFHRLGGVLGGWITSRCFCYHCTVVTSVYRANAGFSHCVIVTPV